MRTRAHTTPVADRRWTIRFILFGGAVAWTLHLLSAYAIAEFGTISGFAERRWSGLDAVSWLLLLASVAMIAFATTSVVVARRFRTACARDDARPDALDEAARTAKFCARFGVETNAVFLAVIVVQTIPVFYFLRT